MADLLEGPPLKTQVFEDEYTDRGVVRWVRQLTATWQIWLNQIAITVNILSNRVRSGTGSPEGIVTAGPGTLYLRSDGGAGTCLYVKESARTLNTGWAAK